MAKRRGVQKLGGKRYEEAEAQRIERDVPAVSTMVPAETAQRAVDYGRGLFAEFANITSLAELPAANDVKLDIPKALDGYSRERGLAVAERYARGDKTLLHISGSEPDFPSYAMILRWINDYPEFAEWWKIACKVRARVYIDLMIPAILAHTQLDHPMPHTQAAYLRMAAMRIKYLESQARCLDPDGFGTVAAPAESPTMSVVIVSPDRPQTIEEWVRESKPIDAQIINDEHEDA